MKHDERWNKQIRECWFENHTAQFEGPRLIWARDDQLTYRV